MSGHMPLVIAFGNTLRCDDGAGAAVAQQLEGAVPDAHIIVVPQLLPELCEPVAHAPNVVFVDATIDGAHGAVATHRVSAASTRSGDHYLSPERLLGLARTLFDRTPEAYLVSIGGAQFGFGTALSAEVSAAVPTAVRAVADLIRAAAQPRESGAGPQHT